MAKKSFKNVSEAFISTAQEEPQAPAATTTAKANIESIELPEGYRIIREQKSARMQLLVRPTTKAGIKRIAAAQGLSINELAGNIFDEFIERWEKE